MKESLELASLDFNKVMKEIEDEEEAYWNSLSKEQQLSCFNSVCRRIYKGDIQDKGTYRYVLYQIFGFGMESYARAQQAGYLAIHNAFWDQEENIELVKAFCRQYDVPDAESKVKQFFR